LAAAQPVNLKKPISARRFAGQVIFGHAMVNSKADVVTYNRRFDKRMDLE
jgi:hypothetical protein